jgi:DNA polymerase III subunit delta'
MTEATSAEDAKAQPTPLAPWLAAQRDTLLRQRGHAWLLHGPSGLGQYELALSLAQAWLCEAPGKQPGDAACGHCQSCHLIETRAHPDLAMLMPEVQMLDLGWPLSEKAQSDIDDKKRKPSKEIRVDAMREAIEFAQLTSGRGRGKAVVVYPAERMNVATANALLKTLEEPTGDVKFALATESAHQLLPTIRSRCQSFAMRWPSEDEAVQWLAAASATPDAAPSKGKGDGPSATKATPQTIQAALQAAGGRPLDALDLLADGRASVWAKIPIAMLNGNVAALQDWSPQAALDALQKLCHDIWAVKIGANPRFFSAADLPKPPPARALSAWNQQLNALARSIDHTWKAELLIEDLVSQARLALNSRQ